MGAIPLRARVWLLMLFASSAAVIGVAISSAQVLSLDDWFVVAALLTLIVVVERLDVSFSVGSGILRVSIGGPIAFASGLHFGVGVGVLIVLTGHIIDSILARRDPIKSATNIGAHVCGTFAGSIVYAFFAVPDVSPLGSAGNLIGVFSASLAYVTVSSSAVTLIVAPVLGIRFVELLPANFKLSAVEAVALPALGGLITVLADENGLAVLLIAFPLLAPQMAYRALSRAQQNTRAAIETLSDAVEQRDEYTANHSVRVTRMVELILAEMRDVPHQLTATILVAARIHDVGKVGTRDVALLKPGPLTPAERRELERHPVVGAQIVSRIQDYQVTAAIIRHHHERWDGAGYPDGLSGEDIPLGARIVGVADAFDAMTTDRPYRKALSIETAMHELRRNSGTQFDPAIVAAFDRAMGTTPSATPVTPAPARQASSV